MTDQLDTPTRSRKYPAIAIPRKHIDALITWAIAPGHTPIYFIVAGGQDRPVRTNESEAGQLLHDQHVRSVNQLNGTSLAPKDYHWTYYPNDLTLLEVIKACGAYECEIRALDGYRHTGAALLIEAIRNAAIELLPGYKEGRWLIED